jgi:hypothetical protein
MHIPMNSISRVLRTGGLAATLALGVGLAGCDDDNDGGGGGGGAGPADLSSVEGAQAQVGNLAQILQAMDLVTDLPGGSSVASAKGGGVSAKAVRADDDCESGSVSDTGPTNKNVNSPYTQQQISVSGIEYEDCQYSSSEEGSTLTFTLDGISESGSVTDGGNEVSYLKVGNSRSNPLSFDYEAASNGAEFTIELGLYLRDDYREAENGDEDGEFVFNIDGDYIVNAAGQRVSSGFRYYMGTTDEPFVSTQDSTGLAIDGEYGFTFSGQVFDAIPSCAEGGVKVSTDERLVESEGGASPFTAGKLTLSAGGDEASVTFNDDNTVTVEVGGESETVAYSALLAGAAPCANLGLAGLYLASGFAR